MKKVISLFVVPYFDINSSEGGAENICRLVALALSEHFEVYVLHSETNRNNALGKITNHKEGLNSCNAFYLDDWTKNRGEISPDFCGIAKSIIAKSNVLLGFERTVKEINIPQLTVLGGVSYIHCKDVVLSNEWDRLIVPSNFVKQFCSSLRKDSKGISVVSNGIDCKAFYCINENIKKNKVLLPFRPDRRKGFLDAIDFVNIINSIGIWGNYSILITRLDVNTFVEKEFYVEIDQYARTKNVVIEYIPWCKNGNMNEVYNMADFVLSLGDLEEGFGLTTIESILTKTMVVSKKIGATIDILPPNCGIVFSDSEISEEVVGKIMTEIVFMNNTNIEKGIDYIKENYGLKKMQEEYVSIISEYID